MSESLRGFSLPSLTFHISPDKKKKKTGQTCINVCISLLLLIMFNHANNCMQPALKQAERLIASSSVK